MGNRNRDYSELNSELQNSELTVFNSGVDKKKKKWIKVILTKGDSNFSSLLKWIRFSL